MSSVKNWAYNAQKSIWMHIMNLQKQMAKFPLLVETHIKTNYQFHSDWIETNLPSICKSVAFVPLMLKLVLFLLLFFFLFLWLLLLLLWWSYSKSWNRLKTWSQQKEAWDSDELDQRSWGWVVLFWDGEPDPSLWKHPSSNISGNKGKHICVFFV